MNKVFKTKFDPATGLSYAVSELSRNMLKTVTVVAIGGLALSTTAQAAECTLSGATYTINGKTCDLPGDQLVDRGLHILNSTVSANKLEYENNADIGIALFVRDSSTLNVTGDVNITANSARNAAFQISLNPGDNQNNVNIDGNLTINSGGTESHTALRSSSTLNVKGDVLVTQEFDNVNISGAGIGLINQGSSTFEKNVKIETNNVWGINVSQDHKAQIKGDLELKVKENNSQAVTLSGLRLVGGEVAVGGTTKIETESKSHAISIALVNPNASANNVNEAIDDGGISFSSGTETVEEREAGVAKITLAQGDVLKTVGEDAHTFMVGNASGLNLVKLSNKATMTSEKGNALDLTEFAGEDALIGNTGKLLAENGYVLKDGKNAVTFVSADGEIKGNIDTGEGDDSVSIVNTKVSSLAILDGGDGEDILDFDFNLTGSSNSNGEANNTKIAGWEVVNVLDNGRLNLTGDLNPSTADKGLLTVSEQAALALNASTQEAKLNYHVQNFGEIDLTKGSTNADSKLTVEGNYVGYNGSSLLVKSNWNNPDVQANDQLVIKGTASGQTVVKVLNGVIGGDVIRDNIEKNGGWSNPVVVVEGGDGGNEVFTGTANTSSASQAQLTRKEENGVAKYTWTLKAGDQYIYAHPVTGYVLQPYINSQMGLAQLGQLHQRVGEQYKNGLENKQVWGRLSLNNEDLQGANRFGAKVRSGFVQFGKDVIFKQNADQSHRHIGLTATYGWANSSFYDKYNAKNGEITADKYTGKSKTNMFSVGGYHTDYAANGWYIDRVAQISWLRNKYKSEQEARQTGWGFGASVETGKPYPLQRNPNWAIEPQAQLSYQWFKLGSVNDGERYVQGKNQHNLTARLGARLTWNKSEKDNQAQAYFGTHFIQTLMGRTSEVKVGQDRVQENMGGLVVAFDLGGQYPITKNLSLYGDVRYQISLDKHRNSVYRDSHLARESYNGRVGLRYTW